MLKQLRRKFIFITMALLLVVLTVVFCLVYSFTKADMEERNRATIQRLTQAVSTAVAMEQLPQDVRSPWFAMRVSNGIITAVGYTGYDLNDEAFLNEILAAVQKKDENEGTLGKYDLMYRRIGNRQSMLIILLDISGQRTSLRSLVESCLAIGVASLAAFWLISLFLARWAVKPVEKAWDRQRQFVSDASHELKTPLTVIMSNAELLQEEPESAQRYSQSILTMSHQMKGLVEGLLELARVDNGRLKTSVERVNISDLATRSLLEFEPVLFERGLQLESVVQPDIWLSGSNRYLKQVVDILLDNAGKYSDPGVVDVQLTKQGKICHLTVANPGQPIPEKEQKKIFERFYRSDQARTRNGSYGLGLSIAQSVVQEHRGKIWVTSNATGNCFHVQFPCE